MTAYDSRSTIKTRSPPALWVCTLLGIVLRCRVRDRHERQIYRSDCDRGRRIREHACVLDQGMGRIPVADPAGRALARLRTRTAHPAGIRPPQPDLLPPCRAVRIGPHPLRAELRPLRQNGWMMLILGIFGVLAGILILFGSPSISVWALGFLVGVDLISHGLAWLLYALRSVRRTA